MNGNIMREETFKQCKLKLGDSRTVGWIPERAAVVGYSVQLTEFGDDFWHVDEVSNVSVTKSFLAARSRDYKQFQGSTRGGGIDE